MVIFIKLLPGSSRDFVSDDFVEYLGIRYRKVYVIAKPIENEANTSLVKLLSKFFKVSKSEITLKKGEKSRYKIFEINN